jgi:hypothetical protein
MPRWPRVVLAVGGGVMVLAGAGGMALGTGGGAFVRALLPPVAVDASAVGGATVALSAVVVGFGAVQLLLARAVSRPGRWTAAAAVILSGLLAAASLAVAVVSATQAAAGGPAALLAVAATMLVIALAYAAASMTLARTSV